MYLTPSDAISRIEADRAKLNKKFELLRTVSQTLLEMGIAKEEYQEFDPIRKRKKEKHTVHYKLMSSEKIEECADSIKVLKSFEKSKKKPSEETIRSVRQKLIIKYVYATSMYPEETLEYMDEDKADTNKRLDELKFICQTLIRYGITEQDYRKAFENYFWNSPRPNDMVWFSGFEQRVEAFETAQFIENSEFKPYKSWWDKLFRKVPMDATLKALLNRLLELYLVITNK